MRNFWLISTILLLGSVSLFIYPIKTEMNKPAVTTQFPNKIQEVLPSVVHIMCDRWQGSGVAIAPDIVVTARHVVDGTNYTITLNDDCRVKVSKPYLIKIMM